jgi:hypothetical protein
LIIYKGRLTFLLMDSVGEEQVKQEEKMEIDEKVKEKP